MWSGSFAGQGNVAPEAANSLTVPLGEIRQFQVPRGD